MRLMRACLDQALEGVRLEMTAMQRRELPDGWDSEVPSFDPDEKGMATEDLVVADLNGDKQPDIVASGRATRNVKIYWNETAAKKKH